MLGLVCVRRGAVRCLVFWLGIDGYKGERKEGGRKKGKEGRKERGHERKESWKESSLRCGCSVPASR